MLAMGFEMDFVVVVKATRPAGGAERQRPLISQQPAPPPTSHPISPQSTPSHRNVNKGLVPTDLGAQLPFFHTFFNPPFCLSTHPFILPAFQAGPVRPAHHQQAWFKCFSNSLYLFPYSPCHPNLLPEHFLTHCQSLLQNQLALGS